MKNIRNVFIIFIVSGFWHGANWTFIVWGALNAIYFLPLLLADKNRSNLDNIAQGKYFPTSKELFSMLTTFGITVIAWIFFRADNVGHAFSYLSKIFSSSLFSVPVFEGEWDAFITVLLIFCFTIIEWVGRENKYAIEKLGLNWNRWIRYAFYYALILTIIKFTGEPQEFIYFQF